eukprot:11519132-Alexandrium_andersonii.AAC.1
MPSLTFDAPGSCFFGTRPFCGVGPLGQQPHAAGCRASASAPSRAPLNAASRRKVDVAGRCQTRA